jgi:E3 ubiquitin-protein ligase makorin
MEVVVDRLIWSERRFGILSGCDHCFCLSCIRKWRNSLHTSKKIIRACPICREISYLVIPSEVWITDQEDKDKLLALYKSNLWYERAVIIIMISVIFIMVGDGTTRIPNVT